MNEESRTPAIWALIVVLALECAAAAIVTVVLLVEVLTTPSGAPGAGLALLVLAGLAAVWAAAMVVAVVRGRAWVRGSAIVWQVIQFAVGASALTGVGPQPEIAWPLIILALVGGGLLFGRSARAWLTHRGTES